jgi:hypothetical protein
MTAASGVLGVLGLACIGRLASLSHAANAPGGGFEAGRTEAADDSDRSRMGHQGQRRWPGRSGRPQGSWSAAAAEPRASRRIGCDHRERTDPSRSWGRAIATVDLCQWIFEKSTSSSVGTP